MRRGVLAVASLLLGCSSFGSTPAGDDASAPSSDAGADAAPFCPEGTVFDTRANCGRCGHDCGAGDCNAGACSPYPIVDNTLSPPWYLAVDDTHVYWTSFHSDVGAVGDGSIARAPKLGGSAAQVLARPQESFDLIIDGNDLLFTSPTTVSGVFRLPKAGGDPVAVDDRPALMIVNGPNGWLVTSRKNAASAESAITLIPRAGSVQRLVPMTDVYNPEGIGWDGKDVYWANHNGPGTNDIGSIGRKLSNQSAQIEWAPNQKNARHLVVDGPAVYWTGDGGVHRRLTDGGSGVVTLYQGDVRYGLLASHDTSLFICSMMENRVVRVPKLGGAPVELARVKEPVGITQDAKAIYFAEHGANRIWRMVK